MSYLYELREQATLEHPAKLNDLCVFWDPDDQLWRHVHDHCAVESQQQLTSPDWHFAPMPVPDEDPGPGKEFSSCEAAKAWARRHPGMAVEARHDEARPWPLWRTVAGRDLLNDAYSQSFAAGTQWRVPPEPERYFISTDRDASFLVLAIDGEGLYPVHLLQTGRWVQRLPDLPIPRTYLLEITRDEAIRIENYVRESSASRD